MSLFERFTGQFPVSKTLRFELRPIGKTWDNLESCEYLKDDEERARQYSVVKELLDENHRNFIRRILPSMNIDWADLIAAYKARKTDLSDDAKTALKDTQDRYRKEITTIFRNQSDYKDLFSKKALDAACKIAEERGISEEIDALSTFDKFSIYFTGYHDARKNIYQPLKGVSIPWRIVTDNMPIFLSNIQLFEKVKAEAPELIETLKNNLGVDDIESYFSENNYNTFLTQEGIDSYNYILEGKTTETDVIQGMNVLLNLKHQSDPSFSKILLKPLYKQILSVRKSASFIPRQFETQTEMLSAVCEFIMKMDSESVTSAFLDIITNIQKYDVSKIYIEKSNLNSLSVSLLDSWDALDSILREYRLKLVGDKVTERDRKNVDKWMNSSEFTMGAIIDAMDASSGFDVSPLVDRIRVICDEILDHPATVSSIKNIEFDDCDEETRDESATKLRLILTPYLNLLHYMKIFTSSEVLDRDTSFYADIEKCMRSLSDIVPLFNMVRNYCTRKTHDDSKIKVRLGIPTLADGWDINKEKDNKAIILRKDGNYYLAVFPPKSTVELREAENASDSFYEKMDYKLLPDPSKMLPKVTIKSKTGIERYHPSESLIEGYDQGKHKKGENFDIKFCHELIDFYKGCIREYPGWDVFDFKFSDTSEYADISAFYAEVAEQGYCVSFRKILSEDIYKAIDEGKMFFFQIYNKDFSEKTRGNPNLHTLYWRALFSEENIKSPSMKLNGQAELFFRRRSIKEESRTIHSTGQKLIGRRDTDGYTIPAGIYRELNRFYNGRASELSESAGRYVGRIKIRDASYDIIKDHRFTVDKMFFHVPLTFNYKKKDHSMELNQSILREIVGRKDIKIIGIDRGERNLVYLSMIDRNGRIIEQRSLNVLDKYDYQQALNVREYGNKESRRNWTNVEGIKQFKEGYISKLISEITKIIIEKDAILVMEDLNYGFKRGRFKIEKQVYQKFENMLINKMNYLVFKDRQIGESGSVLNGYQLTKPVTDVQSIGKQTGVIFYVPAFLTSKIDPITGFANLFSLSSIKNTEQKREFLSKMDSIRYDDVTDMFVFSFDYQNYPLKSESYRNNWDVHTIGERYVFSRSKKCWESFVPTEEIKKALSAEGIEINGDLRDRICDSKCKTVESVYYAFIQTLNMRVQNDTDDYILSPVMDEHGRFYDSRESKGDVPTDADANGAYNIALKGDLLLKMIEEEHDPNKKITLPPITNASWLSYMQSGRTKWRN